MKPIDAAWRVLKEEDFDLQQALDANMNSDGQLAQALAQARAKPPAPPLQLEKLPPMNRQTTLPPELTAGASEGKKNFSDINFPSSFGQ